MHNYSRVNIKCDGNHKLILLHRLIAHIFYNLQVNDNTVVVNHINGNTLDWHPSNLNVITRSDNGKLTYKTRTKKFHKNNDTRLKKWKFDLNTIKT